MSTLYIFLIGPRKKDKEENYKPPLPPQLGEAPCQFRKDQKKEEKESFNARERIQAFHLVPQKQKPRKTLCGLGSWREQQQGD